MTKFKINDVIQINPNRGYYGGCFAIVTEVGLNVLILDIPQKDRSCTRHWEHPDHCSKIGKAEWCMQLKNEDKILQT